MDPQATTPNDANGIAPCSLAELESTDLLAARILSSGLAVTRTSIWVRPARGNVLVLFCLLGIGAALLSAAQPIAAGICLVVLFCLWTFEAGGFPTPMSLAAPRHATQDLLNRGASGPRSRVLMLVRPDSPLARSQGGNHIASASWLVVGVSTAMLLVLSAIAAVGGTDQVISGLSLMPSLALVICIAGVLLATRRRVGGDPLLMSGLPQAMDAIKALNLESDPAIDLLVVGASTSGRDRRVLRSHQDCNAACRTWEYATAADVVSAVRSAIDKQG